MNRQTANRQTANRETANRQTAARSKTATARGLSRPVVLPVAVGATHSVATVHTSRVAARASWVQPLVVTGALTAAMLLLLLGVMFGTRDAALRTWRAGLSTVDQTEARAHLEQALAWGDQAPALLAEALGSSRSTVVIATEEVLSEQLAQWELLPAGQAWPRLARLAEELARRVPRYSPAARQAAGDLALRMLIWPQDVDVPEALDVAASCETILAEDPSRRGRVDEVRRRRIRSRTSDGGARGVPSSAIARVPVDADFFAALSKLPVADRGGDGSVNLASGAANELPGRAPGDEPVLGESLSDSAAANEAGSSSSRLPASGENRAVPRLLEHVEPDALAVPRGRLSADGLGSSPSTSDAERNAEAGPDVVAGWDSMTTAEVLRALRRAGRDQAGHIEAELSRRGWSSRQLEWVRIATGDDVGRRLALVNALPGVRGIDAKAWLLWMSDDPSAVVRRAVVGIMATTAEPEMLGRVAAMAEHDSDAEVRALAERAAGLAGRQ